MWKYSWVYGGRVFIKNSKPDVEAYIYSTRVSLEFMGIRGIRECVLRHNVLSRNWKAWLDYRTSDLLIASPIYISQTILSLQSEFSYKHNENSKRHRSNIIIPNNTLSLSLPPKATRLQTSTHTHTHLVTTILHSSSALFSSAAFR